MDPHPFHADPDPDPGFEKFADEDPDPDPGCEKFADLDPDPGGHFYYILVFFTLKNSKKVLWIRIKMRIRIQIQGLENIYFGS